MNARRLRRLERIALARRRAAEVQLAAAGRRLDEADREERAAREGRSRAAGARQAALAAGVDAGRAAALQQMVDAWQQAVAAAGRSRQQAAAAFEQARQVLVAAYRDQRSLERLAEGAERREAQEQERRQRAVADEVALMRFAFARERR